MDQLLFLLSLCFFFVFSCLCVFFVCVSLLSLSLSLRSFVLSLFLSFSLSLFLSFSLSFSSFVYIYISLCIPLSLPLPICFSPSLLLLFLLYAYTYTWQQGHLLPTFCSNMPIFTKFYSKNGSKMSSYMDKCFAFFDPEYPEFSISFWRMLGSGQESPVVGDILRFFFENLLLAGEMLKMHLWMCFWLWKC